MNDTSRLKSYVKRYVQRCQDCRSNPAVFIQLGSRRIGVCLKHWRRIAKSDMEW